MHILASNLHPPTGGLRLNVFANLQYEKGKSTLFTSNQNFTAWVQLLGDDAEAILDRILDRKSLILISIEGKSQRINRKNIEMKN